MKAEALLLRNPHAGYVSYCAGESGKALLTLEKVAFFDRLHVLLSTQRKITFLH